MNYVEYQKALGLRPQEDPKGVTFIHLEFASENGEGYGSINLIDGEPVLLQMYEWIPISREYLMDEVRKAIGKNFKLVDTKWAGNGHWSALIEVEK
jgi:hypothetical protein